MRDKSFNRDRQEDEPDWIGSGADKKLTQGGCVSNLIKIFDDRTTIYDPGAHLNPVLAHTMALLI
jgi:hypothetical protein